VLSNAAIGGLPIAGTHAEGRLARLGQTDRKHAAEMEMRMPLSKRMAAEVFGTF
jgi:hypothetical protein